MYIMDRSSNKVGLLHDSNKVGLLHDTFQTGIKFVVFASCYKSLTCHGRFGLQHSKADSFSKYIFKQYNTVYKVTL